MRESSGRWPRCPSRGLKTHSNRCICTDPVVDSVRMSLVPGASDTTQAPAWMVQRFLCPGVCSTRAASASSCPATRLRGCSRAPWGA